MIARRGCSHIPAQLASDLSGWRCHKPIDPLNELALSWHAYGGTGSHGEGVVFKAWLTRH